MRAGIAGWYRQFAKRDILLPALEQEARAAKGGLWAGTSPLPPWEWLTAARAHAGDANSLPDLLSAKGTERPQIGYSLATA